MKYILTVRSEAGDLIFARTVGVSAETASMAEMEAEALDGIARELAAQARVLRAEKVA